MDEEVKFDALGIDDRILRSIVDLGWKKATAIQEKAIPLALQGKDILARACTGSGKTAAFAIPIVQQILKHKKKTGVQSIRALILTPTKELCAQISDHIKSLCSYCSREVRCVDLAVQTEVEAQKPILATMPDIVIGTPNKILNHLKAKSMNLKESLEFLVIDEADLVFSLGYEEEMKEITDYFSESYQAFLTSATLNDDVKVLKKLLLHDPVTLKLQEAQLPSSSQLMQYHIKCLEEDKYTLIYALLKLNLIKGRSIIFVSSVDRCYRLKLFLEQFAIHSCILNSEMPSNSRCHIVQQFNEGKYDIIISADESYLQNVKKEMLPKTKRVKDPESGIARGIDFHHVENVINFDFPRTLDEYVHRVGRTARAFNEGAALSFITTENEKSFKRISSLLAKQTNEDVFKPYQFRMEELDGFKYRARDAYRAVTNGAVKQARLKDIKQEIMKSERLKSYFAKNPRDFEMLLHGQDLHIIRDQPHLRHVPDYIVPPSMQGSCGYRNPTNRNKRKKEADQQASRGQKRFAKKKTNPLESFDI